MKKSLIITAALLALASCGLKEEFQPVFTGKYPAPEPERYWSDEDFGRITSIADLVSGYTIGQPKVLTNTVIKGVVTTTDRPGNFYKISTPGRDRRNRDQGRKERTLQRLPAGSDRICGL